MPLHNGSFQVVLFEELDIERNDWDGVQILSISIPSLKRLSIVFSGDEIDHENETKINTPKLGYLRKGHKVLLNHDDLIFKYLSRLELGTAIWIDWSLLPILLESAPNLEVLVFPEGLVFPKNDGNFSRFSWTYSPSPENIPKCLKFRLKTIEIRNFVGAPSELYLMKFLLMSSKVLQRMVIHHFDFSGKWEKSIYSTCRRGEITSLPRASQASPNQSANITASINSILILNGTNFKA
ncbi:putative FBD-associated F-box protein At1g55030 [Rutidosis leptorrhynchoides]|uniref:putative FBD-associated F-box protein At1g55030 n=1 Tax=Rutidosis leptorrhynchoides TaxID=125765 RepID=UPI003A99399D